MSLASMNRSRSVSIRKRSVKPIARWSGHRCPYGRRRSYRACIPIRVGMSRTISRAGPRMWDPGRGSHGVAAASSISFVRTSRSARATRASSRASGAPRQKCGPCPNARCGFGARVMSNRPGSGNAAGSRLAAPMTASTIVPAGTAAPPRSTSRRAIRYIHCNGDRYLSTSSIADGSRSGSAQPGELLRVLAQAQDGVADQVRGRLAAGQEQELEEPEDLHVGEPLAVHLGPGQPGEQVVPRVGAAGGEQVPEVAVNLGGHRRKPLGRGPGRGRRAADGVAHRQDGIGPPLEPRPVFGRDTEHLGDHQHRQRGCEVRDQIDLPLHGHPVQQLLAKLPDAGLKGRHGPGGERLRHQPAELGVPGRVGEDHPVRPVPGAERGGVGKHPLDPLVVEDQPQPGRRVMEHRCGSPQALVRWVGIPAGGLGEQIDHGTRPPRFLVR